MCVDAFPAPPVKNAHARQARGGCLERNCTGALAPPRRGKIGTLVTNAIAPDFHETHRPYRPVPRRPAED
ncbi:hypothetical protein ABTF50_20370, partial [Acinetobacter baumannii]